MDLTLTVAVTTAVVTAVAAGAASWQAKSASRQLESMRRQLTAAIAQQESAGRQAVAAEAQVDLLRKQMTSADDERKKNDARAEVEIALLKLQIEKEEEVRAGDLNQRRIVAASNVVDAARRLIAAENKLITALSGFQPYRFVLQGTPYPDIYADLRASQAEVHLAERACGDVMNRDLPAVQDEKFYDLYSEFSEAYHRYVSYKNSMDFSERRFRYKKFVANLSCELSEFFKETSERYSKLQNECVEFAATLTPPPEAK